MELAGLAEPVGLRARVASDPDAVRAKIASGRLVVAPLWKAWGPELAAHGLDRAALSEILRGSGYELWLWAVGERTWAQCTEGLAGRVRRRVGAPAPVKTRTAPKTGKNATKATRTATKATRTTKTAKTAKRAAGPARKTRRR